MLECCVTAPCKHAIRLSCISAIGQSIADAGTESQENLEMFALVLVRLSKDIPYTLETLCIGMVLEVLHDLISSWRLALA